MKWNKKKMLFYFAAWGMITLMASGCGSGDKENIADKKIEETIKTREQVTEESTYENVDSEDVTFTMDGIVEEDEYNYTVIATNNVNHDFAGFYADVTLYDENNNVVETKHFDYSKDFLAHEQIEFPFTSKNQAYDYNIQWGYDDIPKTDSNDEESSFIDEVCGNYYIEHVGYRYIFQITPECVTVEEPSGYMYEYSSVYVSQDDKEESYSLVAKNDYGTYIFTLGVYGDVYITSSGQTPTKHFDNEESRLTHLPDDYQEPVEPYVGMTAEQVEASTWGKPNDINKTTTQYGVNEQWVYSNDKYIYLEDGVVTAIQE